MKIEHIALWVKDLERQKEFYQKYFNAVVGEKYVNSKKNFESYFLSFDTGPRLEIMTRADIVKNPNTADTQHYGLIHFAVSVGSKEKVDKLTQQLKQDGYPLLDGPRTTGDGYYESVIMDAEGNRIEITI
jgi:lactoylglutathione lyase